MDIVKCFIKYDVKNYFDIRYIGEAFYEAVKEGHLEIVKLLTPFVKEKAYDWDFKFNCNEAVFFAMERGHTEIIKFFVCNDCLDCKTIREVVQIAKKNRRCKENRNYNKVFRFFIDFVQSDEASKESIRHLDAIIPEVLSYAMNNGRFNLMKRLNESPRLRGVTLLAASGEVSRLNRTFYLLICTPQLSYKKTDYEASFGELFPKRLKNLETDTVLELNVIEIIDSYLL